MSFSNLAAGLDAVVFDALGDAATVAGRPVVGMFAAPWLQPQLGKLNTAIREPRLVVRDADAIVVSKGAALEVAGQGSYVVVSIEPDGTGLTALVLRPA
jgi:hypothetical protein